MMTDRCPICGRECDYIYLLGGQAVGCDRCIVCAPVHDYAWTGRSLKEVWE